MGQVGNFTSDLFFYIENEGIILPLRRMKDSTS